jgi:hypothetical protein
MGTPTYTAEQIARLNTRPWTHLGTGDVRLYVTLVPGIEVHRYNTGNISAATLDGEEISNAQAKEILNAKVWFSDGELYVAGCRDRAEALVRSAIDRAIARA